MRMITKALLSAVCLTFLCVSEASAQPQIEDLGCKNPLKRECWISSTTTTFVYLSTGLSNLLGPMTSNSAANRPELLAAYMEANEVAFTDDVTVGAGPTLEDIAMLYAVAPGARALLRQPPRAAPADAHAVDVAYRQGAMARARCGHSGADSLAVITSTS